MTINVSGRQFADPQFVAVLDGALAITTGSTPAGTGSSGVRPIVSRHL